MVSTAQKSRSKCHVTRQFSADHSLGNVECSCTPPMLSWWERRSSWLPNFFCASVCRQPPVSVHGTALLCFAAAVWIWYCSTGESPGLLAVADVSTIACCKIIKAKTEAEAK